MIASAGSFIVGKLPLGKGNFFGPLDDDDDAAAAAADDDADEPPREDDDFPLGGSFLLFVFFFDDDEDDFVLLAADEDGVVLEGCFFLLLVGVEADPFPVLLVLPLFVEEAFGFDALDLALDGAVAGAPLDLALPLSFLWFSALTTPLILLELFLSSFSISTSSEVPLSPFDGAVVESSSRFTAGAEIVSASGANVSSADGGGLISNPPTAPPEAVVEEAAAAIALAYSETAVALNCCWP